MPKFKVHVQQYVEEVATVEIDAETAEEAVAKVEQGVWSGAIEPDWRDGDDAQRAEAYSAHDAKDNVVWQR